MEISTRVRPARMIGCASRHGVGAVTHLMDLTHALLLIPTFGRVYSAWACLVSLRTELTHGPLQVSRSGLAIARAWIGLVLWAVLMAASMLADTAASAARAAAAGL